MAGPKKNALLRTQCFIGGEWIYSKKTFSVDNPATGKTIAHVPDMGAKETNDAIAAAAKAFGPWKALLPKQRAKLLKAWFELIIIHADELAELITAEQGKPLAEAKGEILYAASFIEWFAEEGKRAYGEVIASPKAGQRIITIKQPVGVVAAITPWNFPAAMITRKVAPALAAGCTVVLKPAEDTPLTALALAVLAEQAGIPAGVLNIITGKPEVIGQALMKSQVVRKLSFTGSTEVGKILYKASADTLKKLSLELGGNAPFIVFEDADIKCAIEALMYAKFRNGGQSCICSNRILVQASIADTFIKQLVDKVRQLKLGDGFAKGTNIGPMINAQAIEKIERLVKDAKHKKARLWCGGTSPGGCYFEPTVMSGITLSMAMWQEEIFGPVIAIATFKTEEEAIGLANNTPHGLASYFFTQDYKRQWRVAEALESGMVGVNDPYLSNEVAPFGGIKESGIGREGSHHGLEEYMEIKYICVGVS